MSKNDISIRLYFDRSLYETARLIGYNGVSPESFWKKAKDHKVLIRDENGREKEVPFFGTPDAVCSKDQVERAVDELTTWQGREARIPAYILKPEVRKACSQLLGPAPENPLADFIRHGPPDLMGEENATRWQEQYRKRKEKEAEETKAEEQTQEQPKKRAKKGRSR